MGSGAPGGARYFARDFAAQVPYERVASGLFSRSVEPKSKLEVKFNPKSERNP